VGCSPNLFSDELPQRLVELDPFWIDQHEVTNEQFAEFVHTRTIGPRPSSAGLASSGIPPDGYSEGSRERPGRIRKDRAAGWGAAILSSLAT